MQRYIHLVVLVVLVLWLAWRIGEKRNPAPAPAAQEVAFASTPVNASSSTGSAGNLPQETGLSQSFRTQPTELQPAAFVLNVANSRQALKMANGANVLPDVADLARQLNNPSKSPVDDLELLQKLLDIYRRANHEENPFGGTNEEIAAALRGDNERRFAVLPRDLPDFNSYGELLDRWGTPYWFHPISSHVMEIRSSGPDHQLWTEDDVEIPSGSAQ